ncbi:MAG: hypothetical protein JOZ75_11275 [Candidatus Dormibacteraeota bacterium]|nr:hypothetical protein [Candidatus Dormibacteraeota bacterium]
MLNDDEHRPLEELVFLNRGPVVLRTAAVVITAAGTGIAGYKLYQLHEELALRIAGGAHLDAWRTFVAQAPTPLTVVLGWVAALCFGLALLRLQRGPLEPVLVFRRSERQSVAQLRRGLRREYTTVRLLLVFVVLLAAVDVARTISFSIAATHAGASPGTLWSLYLEAAGLITATLVLVAYARVFGDAIARLGAI